jgi:hypothetical protein
MNDEERRRWTHMMFKSLPGYPFLPCPICKCTESCDDTVLERAQATHPGLVLHQPVSHS